MGPLELIFGWQFVLVAMCASATTQFFKTAVNILIGVKEDSDGKLDYWEAIGRELRRDMPVLNKIVFPTMVVLLGGVIAIIFPVRPEVLHTYAETYAKGGQAFLLYGLWGCFCGMFSDYAYTRVKEFLQARGSSNAG